MHQNIGLLPLLINERKGLLKALANLLTLTVLKVEDNMREFLRVGELQVGCRAHREDVIFLELGDVVGEDVPADPDRALCLCCWNHLLTFVVVTVVLPFLIHLLKLVEGTAGDWHKNGRCLGIRRERGGSIR